MFYSLSLWVFKSEAIGVVSICHFVNDLLTECSFNNSTLILFGSLGLQWIL